MVDFNFEKFLPHFLFLRGGGQGPGAMIWPDTRCQEIRVCGHFRLNLKRPGAHQGSDCMTHVW